MYSTNNANITMLQNFNIFLICKYELNSHSTKMRYNPSTRVIYMREHP